MDLPDISVEFKAKIDRALADMEILKKAVKSVSDTATRQRLMEAAQGFEKSLKAGMAQNAIKDMYKNVSKDADKAGKDSARSFISAFKKELKNEKNPFNVPGWLPWVGAAMPAAPAAITGLAGAMGALGTAGLGAAAGIAAVGASAMEVLAPVKQAFTTIDKLTTTNAVASNATALQTWLKSGGASSAVKVTGGSSSGYTPAAARARIAMLQMRLQHATTSSAAANYSAELAAAQRHLARMTGAVSAAGPGGVNPLGAGLGFLTNPNVNWYTMTKKQQNALVVAAQSTTGLPSSEKKQIEALMQERQAYTGLNKGQQQALFQYTRFDNAMVGAQQQSQPQVLALFGNGLKAITPLLKFLHPLVVSATAALLPLIKAFGQLFASKSMDTFMANLDKMSKLGISVFGGVLLDFIKGFMNIFDVFARSPVMKIVTNDLKEMGAAFASDTMKKGGGFSIFMNEVKQNAPVIDDLLRNLVALLGHLIVNLGNGFGTAELKGLNMFVGLLNKISSIPGLGGLVYNLTALVLITSKFGSFKLIGAFIDTIGKGVARMAALKFGTMIAGMIGLDTEGMKVAEMWKTIGKNVITFAGNMAKNLGTALLSMTKWVGSMLLQGAKWVARMIVQGVTVAASWIASAATAAAAWVAANATMILVSGGIVLLIGAIVVAVYELIKHWKTVWNWVKAVAKDAWKFIWDGFGKYLLPLLGPVGLIALGAIELAKHWKTVTADIKRTAKDLWQWLWNDFGMKIIDFFKNTIPHAFEVSVHAIATAWDKVRDAVKTPINWVITHVLDGLIGAFDWISGKVGGPHINKIPGLASGGRIPGYGGGDRHLALLEGGEAVVPKHEANTSAFAAWARARGIPGYARGGRIGQNPPHPTGNPHLPHGEANPGGGIGGFFSKIGDIAKITAAVFSGNTKALTNAITNLLPGGFGGAVADTSALLEDSVKTLIKDAVKTLIGVGGLGANAQAIVRYAMQFIGRIPYVWGGTNVPGGADCSGFTQAIYRHFGINAPRTSEEQGAWVKRGPPTPGGLAFYHSPAGGPDPGHVAIVRNANSVISQGGGMGPQVMALHGMPLLWTGTPPGGIGGGAAGPGVAGAEAYASRRMGAYGWGIGQMGSLKPLWTRESGWNRFARNPSSGAYGIPQALPPTKLPLAGQAAGGSQAGPQIDWGLGYIRGRYGSPAGAWAHEMSYGWYDRGGYLSPGWTMAYNGTGRPEPVGPAAGQARRPSMMNGSPVFIQVNTQEIRPQYHAAKLGWELARRAS